MTYHKYECEKCGLIYQIQMLNVVADRDESVLGNHCPNCGSQEVTGGAE